MLDLVTIGLFIRVAEAGSLSRASDEANLAIAAVSRRLLKLEEDMKVQLLVRGRRGITLTPAGEALLVHAQQIMRQVQVTVSDLSEYARGLKGSVDILACTSALAQFLPRDLAAFAGEHRDIRVNIQEAHSLKIVEQLRAGRGQLGVVVSQSGTSGLDTWPYRRDRLVVVALPHVLFGRRSVRFAELNDLDFVQMGENTANTRLLVRMASEQGWPLRLRATVGSYDTVCRMIQAGFGIGVLPGEAASHFIVAMGLKFVDLDEPWASRQLELVADASILGMPERTLVEFLSLRAAVQGRL